VCNRIALDASAVSIMHVALDDNGRFKEPKDSYLNECLTLEANIDQTARAFMQDVYMSLMDEGCIAIVPVDTSLDPNVTGAYDILSMRVGRIVEWYPTYVKVKVYNERSGQKEDVIISKSAVAIIENPFYAVMNEPNSTMQRLIRKLNILDAIDEQSGSGKLDLLIQLPYAVKTDTRRQQAEDRRTDIENQLKGSKFGIAYIDNTEKVTQLNRPVENNLMGQIEYLTNVLYSQLGISQAIMDGSADDKVMTNYNSRIIEPLVSAVVDSMKRTFLTKTARAQNQSILFFRDPFKLVPVSDIAEMADKFTRNEIMTSNEFRQVVGLRPSDDPKADELRNSNINHPGEGKTEEVQPPVESEETVEEDLTEEDYKKAIADLDKFDAELDKLERELGPRELKHYASKYYDPVKAHEYYMRNRELKGRKSTAGLNDEGKNAARYVREQLQTERKAKVQDHKDQTNSKIDTLRNQKNSKIETLRDQKKAKIEAYKNQMQSKIDSLRAQLKGMSKEEKAAKKEQIYAEIDSLRADNKAERARLSEEFNASSSSLRSDYKTSSNSLKTEHKNEKARLKEEYDEKYIEELDKIRADASFQK
jgi:hypothetical protein